MAAGLARKVFIHDKNLCVTIHFNCSDGSKYIQQFAIGQTVQVLKAWLDSEKGIPYAHQMLYLGDDSGGKVMIDPLSLNDFSLLNRLSKFGLFFLRLRFSILGKLT